MAVGASYQGPNSYLRALGTKSNFQTRFSPPFSLHRRLLQDRIPCHFPGDPGLFQVADADPNKPRRRSRLPLLPARPGLLRPRAILLPWQEKVTMTSRLGSFVHVLTCALSRVCERVGSPAPRPPPTSASCTKESPSRRRRSTGRSVGLTAYDEVNRPRYHFLTVFVSVIFGEDPAWPAEPPKPVEEDERE